MCFAAHVGSDAIIAGILAEWLPGLLLSDPLLICKALVVPQRETRDKRICIGAIRLAYMFSPEGNEIRIG